MLEQMLDNESGKIVNQVGVGAGWGGEKGGGGGGRELKKGNVRGYGCWQSKRVALHHSDSTSSVHKASMQRQGMQQGSNKHKRIHSVYHSSESCRKRSVTCTPPNRKHD